MTPTAAARFTAAATLALARDVWAWAAQTAYDRLDAWDTALADAINDKDDQ
jgi:hypothetical protein